MHNHYLVSRHIAFSGEKIAVGTFNGTLPNLGTSPLYNYILASILLVSDSLMSLSVANLILQVISIYIVYQFTDKLFGKWVALTSAIIQSFSSILILQSEWMWPPHLAFFLVNLSYLLLTLYYKDKNHIFGVLGFITLSAAATVHMSIIPLIPILLLSFFFILKKGKPRVADFIYITASAIGSFVLFNFSLIYKHMQSGVFLSSFIVENLPNKASFVDKIVEHLRIFFAAALPNHTIIAVTVLFIGSIFYFRFEKDSSKRTLFGLILSVVISFLILSSLISQALLPQHFVPIYSLIYTVGGLIVVQVFKNGGVLKLISIVVAGLLIYSSSNQLESLKFTNESSNHQEIAESLLTTIQNEAKDLNHDFQFRLYTSSKVAKLPDDIWFFDIFFWSYLERDLKTQFVEIYEPGFYYDYKVLNGDKHLIVGCLYYEDDQNCLDEFNKANPSYVVERKILDQYFGYSFYSAKKSL